LTLGKLLDQSVNTRKIFALSNIRPDNYPALNRRKELKEAQSKPLEEEDVEKKMESRKRAIDKHNKRLAELGIEYQYVSLATNTTTAGLNICK
jgi:hypothetical protein